MHNIMKTIVQTSLDNNKYKLLIINGLIQDTNRQNDAWKYFDLAEKETKKQHLPYSSGICSMLLASYWQEEGMCDFADLYIQKTHKSFKNWKATELAKNIEKTYPSVIKMTNTIDKFNLTNFDFESVMKASHAISEEISLEELLNKIMKIIVENSGSQLGFLLLHHDNKLQVEAAYDFVTKSSARDIQTVVNMPNSIINFVKNSHKNVIYSASSSDKLFKNDQYIKEVNPKINFLLANYL